MTADRERFDRIRATFVEWAHGTRHRYMGGCKCMECRAANSRYETMRAAARRRGESNRIVSAERARAHMRWLSKNGVGRHSVSAATDISDSLLYGICNGTRARLRENTERKILAVDLSVRGGATLISSLHTWRLIHELLDRGYTKTQLAQWLGYKTPALQLKRGAPITVRNANRVEKLYKLINDGKMRRAS